LQAQEDTERFADLSFYGIECGKLTFEGTYRLGTEQGTMDQATYSANQKNLSDLVLVEGIDKTCDMLLGALRPQGLAQ